MAKDDQFVEEVGSEGVSAIEQGMVDIVDDGQGVPVLPVLPVSG